MRAIIDTNILIDYLNGTEKARVELTHYQKPAISIITWMEILIGAEDKAEEAELRKFLTQFYRYELSTEIAEQAVKLRQEHRVRLPDAIIWATALENDAILVTRNTRDFPKTAPDIRIPYSI